LDVIHLFASDLLLEEAVPLVQADVDAAVAEMEP
jgi:hypothetical protein